MSEQDNEKGDVAEKEPTIEELYDLRYFKVTYKPDLPEFPSQGKTEIVAAHMMDGEGAFISFQTVKIHPLRGPVASTILSIRVDEIKRIEEVSRDTVSGTGSVN